MTSRARYKVLRVDPVACDAFGYCAELLPEIVSLDEWGYPIIDRRGIPPELVDLAYRAVRDCPRRALSIADSEPVRAGGDRLVTFRTR